MERGFILMKSPDIKDEMNAREGYYHFIRAQRKKQTRYYVGSRAQTVLLLALTSTPGGWAIYRIEGPLEGLLVQMVVEIKENIHQERAATFPRHFAESFPSCDLHGTYIQRAPDLGIWDC